MPPGPKPKLTPELITKIADRLAEGAFLEQAAAVAGVTRKTVWNWRRAGSLARKKPKLSSADRLYIQFVDAVDKAIAECEICDIQRLDRFAETSERAAMWRLERRFPERWSADRQRLQDLEKQVSQLTELLAKYVGNAVKSNGPPGGPPPG